MNKLMHAVVLVVFGAASWFLSMMILKLPLMVQAASARLSQAAPGQHVLPAFTRLCMGAGPVLLGILALLALGYCIYVFARKAERPAPWTGFLATTMSALVVVLLPCVVAIYIPLVDVINRLSVAVPK
jgi:hypothetical protein